jgi:hypothetical protein
MMSRRNGWVLALAVFLPLLTFGNCVTRGSEYGSLDSGYLTLLGLSLGCTLLCVWLVHRSRLGMIFFLIYGCLLSITPELYWRPQDRAFYDKVMAMKAAGIPTDWVIEERGFPSSAWKIIYSDGEIWMLD